MQTDFFTRFTYSPLMAFEFTTEKKINIWYMRSNGIYCSFNLFEQTIVEWVKFGLFKFSSLLALNIPANPDVVKTFFSLVYTNVMIPYLYP